MGLQVIDLNHDGYSDIVVHNHVKNGEHAQTSFIYWNSPRGFDREHKTELPTLGAHYSQMVDVGNVFTRKLEEEYTSAPIALPPGATQLRLAWKADGLPGNTVVMQIRTAASAEALAAAKWRGATGEESVLEHGDGTRINISHEALFVQYRAVFRSADGGEWPVLTDVEIAVE